MQGLIKRRYSCLRYHLSLQKRPKMKEKGRLVHGILNEKKR